jgi:hypothetical protein
LLSSKISLQVLVSLIVAVSGVSGFSPLTLAQTTTSEAVRSVASLNEEIEKIVKEYYPKAKISVNDKGMHFEYKVKTQISDHSGRPMLVPTEGGILGDITLKSGAYQGAEKGRLPSEEPDGFHTILTMAPYSKDQNSHLLVLLNFPPDMAVDFKTRFKDAINAHYADDTPAMSVSTQAKPQAPGASQPEAAATQQSTQTRPESTAAAQPTASATAAPCNSASSTTSDSQWQTVQAAEAGLSFKIPAAHQEKVVKDQFQAGKFWIGQLEGCKFMVSFLRPKARCLTEADRIKVWNSMLANVLSANNPKFVKEFVFHGVKAREYQISGPNGDGGKAILCVAPDVNYIFMVGGPRKTLPMASSTFIDSVKIGK